MYCEEIRPYWLLVTKGYGFTVDDIDWSSPADLEPYAKAYELRIKQQDNQMYMMGMYVMSALDSTVCNSFLWRKKGAKPHEYLKNPILSEIDQKDKKTNELTEEEKKKQTEKLFMQLRIMGANFNLNHKEDL